MLLPGAHCKPYLLSGARQASAYGTTHKKDKEKRLETECPLLELQSRFKALTCKKDRKACFAGLRMQPMAGLGMIHRCRLGAASAYLVHVRMLSESKPGATSYEEVTTLKKTRLLCRASVCSRKRFTMSMSLTWKAEPLSMLFWFTEAAFLRPKHLTLCQHAQKSNPARIPETSCLPRARSQR